MTATAHALVGAAIATQITNPYLALPLAIFSHFLGDKLPHWDTMTNKDKPRNRIIVETILDVLLGYALVAFIFVYLLQVPNPTLIFAAAFAAQLPDWMEAPYSIFKLKLPLIYDNYRVQSWVHHVWFNSKLKAPWGIFTQIAVVGVVLAFVVLAAES